MSNETTAKSMVTYLRNNGLPLAKIAEFLRADIKDVYDTFTDHTPTKTIDLYRCADAFNILDEAFEGHFGILNGMWDTKSKGSPIPTSFKDILTTESIDKEALISHIRNVTPILERFKMLEVANTN